MPFCRRCCYCDSGTAAVEGTGRVMPGWKRCTGNQEVGGGVSSFPTLSSSSPGAIKMRFPNSREGDAALPRGGGKGQKKFCVPPRVTRRGAWLGTGRTGCGCVQHPSERGRVKPHLPGAPRFLGKKKKRMQCGGGLLAARCPPGCSEPGWRGVRGARPRGSFPCLSFSSSFSFFISLHYTASRPLPGCQQLAGSR